MSYWYLAIAVIAEVIATRALKASEESTNEDAIQPHIHPLLTLLLISCLF